MGAQFLTTKVKMVPKLIGKLEKLETLDLGGTYVTELPDEILHLQKLRNLLSYYLKSRITYFEFGDMRGFKAPSQIGSLQSLQVLSMIEVDQRSECGVSMVKELGRLTQLRELHIGNLRREDGVTLCSSIEKLGNLCRLEIISTKEDEILDLQSLSPVPRFLQLLHLIGHLEKFPHWIPSLHGLVDLTLGWSKLRDDPLQSLQELPNLAKLILEQAYEGEGLCFKAGGFQRLKHLHLYKLKGLRWVRVEEGAMPHLEGLSIRNSELMEEVPSGIQHLKNLQTFELCEMSEKLISKLDREVQDEDYRNIAHIPEVIIWYREHDQWKSTGLCFVQEGKPVLKLCFRKGFGEVVSIHGDKAQHARTKAISLFKEGSCPLMIATDVAARGLDIPDVEVVINYSFPLTTEDYIHRTGRTGRAGKKGVAHTFFMKENKGLAGELVNVMREAGRTVGTHENKMRKFKSYTLWMDIGSMLEFIKSKLYGAHFKEIAANAPKATKITFDIPRFLQLLHLIGHLEKFLHWIPSLHGLVDLTLGWSKLRDDPLQSLQELPNLAKLILEQAYEGEGLCFKAGGFQRLKHLHLYKLKGLRWVRVEEGAMPHLEGLSIRNSELMEEVPSGIQHLKNLQTFELCEMSEKLISKLDREVQDEDYRNIAHIPEVIIWYREHDQWKVRFL
ncbi:hypothetical protein TEA_004191 [Camellia sinensis var. sinensis]|uniref:Helicase C-terminal domain-containing protein n=1 Tax=Camellia sinensis var. sinensis TaxID=542762 RepID=A0A4S4D3D0_CAMSN|nr:hypothetical protein TEA_004191 [Camellia sinensis var. sinensis]